MGRAYIAKDKGNRLYLVVQEGAGSAHYQISKERKVPTTEESRDRMGISEEFEIKEK